MRMAGSQRGFTFLELTVTTAIAGLVFVAASTVIGASRGMERQARDEILLEHELRSSLLSIGDLLRNASDAELGGFDSSQRSSRPTFQRIVASSDGERALGPDAYLEWRATSGGRSDALGGIFLVEGVTVRLIAPKVTVGSFFVQREGTALRIELEVQRASAEGGALATRRGEYVIALRN